MLSFFIMLFFGDGIWFNSHKGFCKEGQVKNGPGYLKKLIDKGPGMISLLRNNKGTC